MCEGSRSTSGLHRALIVDLEKKRMVCEMGKMWWCEDGDSGIGNTQNELQTRWDSLKSRTQWTTNQFRTTVRSALHIRLPKPVSPA